MSKFKYKSEFTSIRSEDTEMPPCFPRFQVISNEFIKVNWATFIHVIANLLITIVFFSVKSAR